MDKFDNWVNFYFWEKIFWAGQSLHILHHITLFSSSIYFEVMTLLTTRIRGQTSGANCPQKTIEKVLISENCYAAILTIVPHDKQICNRQEGI